MNFNNSNKIYGTLDKFKLSQLIHHFSTSVSEEAFQRGQRCGGKRLEMRGSLEKVVSGRASAGCCRHLHSLPASVGGCPRKAGSQGSTPSGVSRRFVGDSKHNDSLSKNDRPKAHKKGDSVALKQFHRNQNFVWPGNSSYTGEKKVINSSNASTKACSSEPSLPSKTNCLQKSDNSISQQKIKTIVAELEKPGPTQSLPPAAKTNSSDVKALKIMHQEKVKQAFNLPPKESVGKVLPLTAGSAQGLAKSPSSEMSCQKFDRSQNLSSEALVTKASDNKSLMTPCKSLTNRTSHEQPVTCLRTVNSNTPLMSDQGLKKENQNAHPSTKRGVIDNKTEHCLQKEKPTIQEPPKSQRPMTDNPIKTDHHYRKEKSIYFQVEQLAGKQTPIFPGRSSSQGVVSQKSATAGSVPARVSEAGQNLPEIKVTSKSDAQITEEYKSKPTSAKIKNLIWPPLYSPKADESKKQNINTNLLKKKIHTFAKNIDLKKKVEDPAFSLGRIFGLVRQNISNITLLNEEERAKTKPKILMKIKNNTTDLKTSRNANVNSNSKMKKILPMTAPVRKAKVKPFEGSNANIVSNAKTSPFQKYMEKNKGKLRSSIKQLLHEQEKYLTLNLKGEIREWKKASAVQKIIEETKAKLRKSVSQKAVFDLTLQKKRGIIKRKKRPAPITKKIIIVPLTKALVRNEKPLISGKINNNSFTKTEGNNADDQPRCPDATDILTKKYNKIILKTMPAKSEVCKKTFKDFIKQKEVEKIKDKFDQAIIPVMQRNIENELALENKQKGNTEIIFENKNNSNVDTTKENRYEQIVKVQQMHDTPVLNKKQFLKTSSGTLSKHYSEIKFPYTCYPSNCLKKPELLIESKINKTSFDSNSIGSCTGLSENNLLGAESNTEPIKKIVHEKAGLLAMPQTQIEIPNNNKCQNMPKIVKTGHEVPPNQSQTHENVKTPSQSEIHSELGTLTTTSLLSDTSQKVNSPSDQNHSIVSQEPPVVDRNLAPDPFFQPAELNEEGILKSNDVEVNKEIDGTFTELQTDYKSEAIKYKESATPNKYLRQCNTPPLDKEHNFLRAETGINANSRDIAPEAKISLENFNSGNDCQSGSVGLNDHEKKETITCPNKLEESVLDSKRSTVEGPTDFNPKISLPNHNNYTFHSEKIDSNTNPSSSGPPVFTERTTRISPDHIAIDSYTKNNLQNTKSESLKCNTPTSEMNNDHSTGALPNQKSINVKLKTITEDEASSSIYENHSKMSEKHISSEDPYKNKFTTGSYLDPPLPKKESGLYYSLSKFFNEWFDGENELKPNFNRGNMAYQNSKGINLNKNDSDPNLLYMGSISPQIKQTHARKSSNDVFEKDISGALPLSGSKSGLVQFISNIFMPTRNITENIVSKRPTESYNIPPTEKRDDISETITCPNKNISEKCNTKCYSRKAHVKSQTDKIKPSFSHHLERDEENKDSSHENELAFLRNFNELKGSKSEIELDESHIAKSKSKNVPNKQSVESLDVHRDQLWRKIDENMESSSEKSILNNYTQNKGSCGVEDKCPRDIQEHLSSSRHSLELYPRSRKMKIVKKTESSEEILSSETPQTILKSKHTSNVIREEYETIKTFNFGTPMENHPINEQSPPSMVHKDSGLIREKGFSLTENPQKYNSQVVRKAKTPQISLNNSFRMSPSKTTAEGSCSSIQNTPKSLAECKAPCSEQLEGASDLRKKVSSKKLDKNIETIAEQANTKGKDHSHSLNITKIRTSPEKPSISELDKKPWFKSSYSAHFLREAKPGAAVYKDEVDYKKENVKSEKELGDSTEEGIPIRNDSLLTALKHLCNKYEGCFGHSKNMNSWSTLKLEPQLTKNLGWVTPDLITVWEPSKNLFTEPTHTNPFCIPKKKGNRPDEESNRKSIKAKNKIKQKDDNSLKKRKFTFLRKRKQEPSKSKPKIFQLKDIPIKKRKRDSSVILNNIVNPREGTLNILGWEDKFSQNLDNPESFWNEEHRANNPDDIMRYIKNKK